jgi:hypothetical protein
MGVDEASSFKRLCSVRRISVGCSGIRMGKLLHEHTQLRLAERGQKGSVREKAPGGRRQHLGPEAAKCRPRANCDQ